MELNLLLRKRVFLKALLDHRKQAPKENSVTEDKPVDYESEKIHDVDPKAAPVSLEDVCFRQEREIGSKAH